MPPGPRSIHSLPRSPGSAQPGTLSPSLSYVAGVPGSSSATPAPLPGFSTQTDLSSALPCHNGASKQSLGCLTLVTLTRPRPHPQTNFPAASDLSHHHQLSRLSRLLVEAGFHHLACPAHTDAGFRALAGEAPASQSCQPSLNPQNTLF